MKKRLLSLVLATMIIMSFIVPASAAKPGVETKSAKDIQETSVVMRGAVTSNSGIRIKEYGFMFVNDGNVSYKKFVSGKDFDYPDPINNDVIECKKTGLKAGKEYCYQFYAINENDEKSVGKSVYFTTKAKSSSGDTKKPWIDDFDCSEGSSFYAGESVKFYAETDDNDKVAEVVLYIDGKVVKTSSDGYISYKTSELTVGKHTISVKVTDASGNYTEEDMTVTVKGKEMLAAPILKAKKSTIEVGEVLELSWDSVKNADYYTINVWATGFSQNYFDTSTEGYLKKITFDKAGTYAVSIYSRTNDHNAYEQSEPYGINITVINAPASHTHAPKNQSTTPKYSARSGDDTYHDVTARYNSVCSCGEILERNINGNTTKERHNFSGNICSDCGYTKKAVEEAVCTHKNTTTSKKNIEKKPTAISGNDTQHNVTEYYDVVCQCGVTIDYNVSNTTKESHSFSGNTCITCGYTKKAAVEEVCTHKNTETSKKNIEKKVSAISGNDTQHNVTEYYDVVCKCGVMISSDVKGDTTKASHSFSDNTCTACGYTKKVVEETNKSIFVDVSNNASYLDEIIYLNERNIITGKPGNKFDPNGYLTRAEAATIICRMSSNSQKAKTYTGFPDVPSSHWASGYIKSAKDNGIVAGRNTGKFDPEGKLTGFEFVKMVVCWLGYGDEAISAYPNETWANQYYYYAKNYLGLLKNMPTGGYNEYMKRSNAAVLAYNALFTSKSTEDVSVKNNQTFVGTNYEKDTKYRFLPIETYTLYNETVSVYKLADPNAQVIGKLNGESKCTIEEIYTNGWAKISSGNIKGYVPAYEFILHVDSNTYEKRIVKSDVKVNRRVSDNSSYGKVSQENVLVVSHNGNAIQIVYKIDGSSKYKMGWVDLSAFNENISANLTTNTSTGYANYNGVNYESILEKEKVNGEITDTEYNNRIKVLNKAKDMVTVMWTAPMTFHTWKSGKLTYNSNQEMLISGSTSTYYTFTKGCQYAGIPYAANTNHNTYDDIKWQNFINKSNISLSELEGSVTYLKVTRPECTFTGIDCSGFVYRAYLTLENYKPGHIGTKAMLESKYWKKIDPAKALPGDVLLKNGHVMIYVGKTSDGKVAAMESVADGERGTSGCRYFDNYGDSELNEYEYYKYTGIGE